MRAYMDPPLPLSEELALRDLTMDQFLMSVRSNGRELGFIEIENGKIVTHGPIGEHTYENFVALIFGLQGLGIRIDDFYF